MARTVNEADYAAKRDDILDTAQRLISAKGFEDVTIQDLLDDLDISKGALYHYFDSKQAILEGLIDRILEQVEQLLVPVVDDTSLDAIGKLQQFFAVIVGWKTGHKPFSVALPRIWYTDENAVLRQKLRETRIRRFSPLLESILRQGHEEGSITASYPDHAGRVILAVVEDLSDTLARMLLADHVDDGEDTSYIDNAVAASTEAVERITGVSPHSLSLVRAEALREWMTPTHACRRATSPQSTTHRRTKAQLSCALVIVVAVVVGYLLLVIALTWAMRLKPVRDTMSHFNRRMLNPVWGGLTVNRLGLFGSIRHRGRRTGKHYVTPVLAVRFGDGFVVPLPYGMQVDWFRNVMSAQECVLVFRKHEYPVGNPQVITLKRTGRAYPWPIRWIFRVGGVNHHVVLHPHPA